MRRASALLIIAGGCASTPSAAPDDWMVAQWRVPPIASAEFESHPAFDRRGNALYFVRSSPSFSGWRLQMSECRGGRWSEARAPSFAGDGVEADPFLTRDGETLYFISSRSEAGVRQRDLDIWRVRRSHGGGWGGSERLPEPVNSEGHEWFPRLAGDGWLYFGSSRGGGLGATDIWRARPSGERWRVENLGPNVNGPGDEYEAEISPDGRRMLLMADGDLWISERDETGWSPRRRLGPEVNSDALEVGPLFSPSGRSFLFARDLGAGRGAGELMVARTGPENWPPVCR